MIQLAQDAASSGLEVSEILIIIGAITAALVNIFTALGWTKAAKVAKQAQTTTHAVVEGYEDFRAAHPELAEKGQEFIRAKAQQLGVELGPGGVKENVRKTRRLSLKNGSALLAFALLPFLQGCAVGPKAEKLIETECRAHDAVVESWADLSEMERQESAEDARAGVYEIRHAVLGTPLPADLQEQLDREKAASEGGE